MQQLLIPIIQTKPMKSTTSSINISKIWLVMVILLCLIVTSCEETPWVMTHHLIVNNNTNKEILALIDYADNKNDNRIKELKGLQTNDTLSSYIILKWYRSYAHPRKYDLWIYNKMDSTYSKFPLIENSNTKLLKLDVKEIQKGRTGDVFYTFTFIMTDSLLTQMKKDTHLTDSVFGLKK
jgi:hypothetical protein